jgi:hypothetical protein
MSNSAFLKVIGYVCMGTMILYGCSTLPLKEFRGNLESGKVYSGSLHVNDVWLFHGDKGSRVVISDMVDNGESPPEIYLYPPNGRQCEASVQGECDCYRVLDHELELSGDYTVLIHTSNSDNIADYKLALAKIPTECTYDISPEDPDGMLIRSKCILSDKSNPASQLAILVGTYVAIPYTVAPALVSIFSGFSTIERALISSSRELDKEIALPDDNKERVAAREEPEVGYNAP